MRPPFHPLDRLGPTKDLLIQITVNYMKLASRVWLATLLVPAAHAAIPTSAGSILPLSPASALAIADAPTKLSGGTTIVDQDAVPTLESHVIEQADRAIIQLGGRDRASLYSGEFIHSHIDFDPPETGLIDIAFARTYRSNNTFNGPLGNGWTHSLWERLSEEAGGYSLHLGDGTYEWLVPFGADYATAGFLMTTLPSGLIEVQSTGGTVRVFEATATTGTYRLKEMRDRLGKKITFAYDSEGRLDWVEDTLRRKTGFTYYPTGRIRTVSHPSGYITEFGYDKDDNLVAVLPPKTSEGQGYQVYAYNGDDNLTTLETGTGLKFENKYTAKELTSHIRGDGSFGFSYIDHSSVGEREAAVIDRNGNASNFFMVLGPADAGVLKRVDKHRNRGIDPTVPTSTFHTTSYALNGDTSIEIEPSGVQTEYWFDSANSDPLAQANIRSEKRVPSDPAMSPVVKWFDYEPNFQQIRRTVDPRAFPNGVVPLILNGTRWELDESAPLVQQYQTIHSFDFDEVSSSSDLNDDGVIGPEMGNIVRIDHPQTVSDSAAPSEKIRYTADGQPEEIEDGLGYVTKFEYWAIEDPFGNLGVLAPEDATDRGLMARLVHDYSSAGATDPRTGRPHLNLATQYYYDEFGWVALQTQQESSDVSMTRNERGLMTARTELSSSPVTTTYEHDLDGRVTRISRPRFDQYGNLDEDFPSATTLLAYDSENRVTERLSETTPGVFNVELTSYDKNGNRALIERYSADDLQKPYEVFSQIYDELDRPARAAVGGLAEGFESIAAHNHIDTAHIVDQPDMATEELRYDDRGFQVQFFRGGSIYETKSYDGLGRLEELISDTGVKTTYDYDALDNITIARAFDSSGTLIYESENSYDERDRILESGTSAFIPTQGSPFIIGDGVNSKEYRYDAAGNLSRVVDDRGMWKETTWNGVGNVHEIVNTAGDIDRRLYDSRGLLEESATELASTENNLVLSESYVYDDQGRRTEAIDSTGKAVKYFYDSEGNLTQVVNRKGNSMTRKFDSENRVLEENLSMTSDGTGQGTVVANRVQTRSYDQAGSLNIFTDGEGRSMEIQYDTLGRRDLVFFDGPSAPTYDFDYNTQGEIQSITDANGTTRTSSYDPNGNLDLVTISVDPNSGVDGSVTAVDYEYDELGRAMGASNGLSNVSRVYDSQGRMVFDSLDIDGHSFPVVSIPTESEGSFTMTYPSGTTVEYLAGQDRNKFHSVRVDGVDTFSFDYLGEDRVENVTVQTGSAQWTENYTFDSEGLLTGLSVGLLPGSGSPLFELTYQRDLAGNIDSTWRSDFPVATLSGYDSAGQLLSHGVEDFGYDLAANLTSYSRNGFAIPFGVNDFNQLESVASIIPIYDSVGNMVQFANVSYKYDYANRLTQIQNGGQTVWSSTYDAFGRRVKTVRGSETKYFAWFGDRMVESFDLVEGALVPTTRILGHRPDDVLMVRGVNQDLFPIRDQRGSVLSVLDATGSVVERYTYSAFGVASAWDPSGNLLAAPTTNLEAYFTGRPLVQEGGHLVDLRTRYFRPGLARFLTRDSIGFAGGWNLYAYAENSPLDSADWMGTDTPGEWEQILDAADPGAKYRNQIATAQGKAIGLGVSYVGGGAIGANKSSQGGIKSLVSKVSTAFTAIVSTLGFGEALSAQYEAAFEAEAKLFDGIGKVTIPIADSVDFITSVLEILAEVMSENGMDHHTFEFGEDFEVTIDMDLDRDFATGTMEGGWDFNVNLKEGVGILRSPDGRTEIHWDKNSTTIYFGDGSSITRHKAAPHKGWTTACSPNGNCITYDEKGKVVKKEPKPKAPKKDPNEVTRVPGAEKRPPKVELAPVKPRPSGN